MRCLPLSRLSDGEKWPLQPNTNRTLYSLRSALRNQGSLTSEPRNTMHAKPRDTVPQVINGRINGRFAPGYSGNPGGSPEAARKALNKDTILEMHRAFKLGGRKAIEKVMRNQPAVFLKLLVLLVPRDMKVEHTGGVKAMTDEQIEAAIEAIQGMLAAREAGADAKVIEGIAEPRSEPGPRRKTKRLADLTLTEPDDNGDNASPKGFER